MKIGRRGSMNAHYVLRGKQGHSAYPHRAVNPVTAIARLCDRLASRELDMGTEHFDASTLALTTIDVGNTASNVIPALARCTANIRFNDEHTGESLTEWLKAEGDRVAEEFGVDVGLTVRISGEAFLTPPGELSALVSSAVEAVTGRTPEPSTTGGTSDARFVKSHCPVVEFGLVGHRMHQVDERVRVEQIGELKAIYTRMLTDYFAAE